MVGHAGSTIGIVHAGMTLTRYKVNVKVTGLLNFRQLAKPCMLAAKTVGSLPAFLVEFPSRKAITRVQTSSNVDISQNSNGHISVLRETTVTWLGKLVVVYYRLNLIVVLTIGEYQLQNSAIKAGQLATVSHTVSQGSVATRYACGSLGFAIDVFVTDLD